MAVAVRIQLGNHIEIVQIFLEIVTEGIETPTA
jgi:hypothetical protein